eukprot:TRINITY_DN35127_c0_g1_i1.p1 TRINITY_DN35127_c0_g1~~TRINITY_DN35127_c0_g1_i1.p1  ORF type:complete len:151 (-),score=8.31 TRINITY_DN35127_c0_g1_i1:307-759(-)
MKSTIDKLEDRLAGILEKNIDAQKGYRKAAENAENIYLKDYFRKKSAERLEFNMELEGALRSAYGELDVNGSLTGAMHRVWMEVKDWFKSDSDEAMLEECIRGDKAAVEEYSEILEDTMLPGKISFLISNQLVKMRSDLNKIKSLEDLKD